MADTTGIQWDREHGDWYVTLDLDDFPLAAREGIEGYVGAYKSVTEAATRLLEVLAASMNAELKHAGAQLSKLQEEADAAHKRLEAHRFKVMMAQAKTEEAGRALQEVSPPKPRRTPRRNLKGVRRFRSECQKRGLDLNERALMLAALSHFFGVQVLDGRDPSAPQWEAAARAVRRGKLGW